LQEFVKQDSEGFFSSFLFRRNFETYFDTQPPFQLGEAILSGSFSEGLFIFSTESPDMDFMCVLKNITFLQHNQEDGSLLLKEDTPFVYAFVTKEETQHLWSEFLDKVDEQTGKRRLSSRKLKEKLEENYKKAGALFHTSGKEEEELEGVADGAAVTIRKPKPTGPSFEYFADLGKDLLRRPFNKSFDAQDEVTHPLLMHTMLDKLFPSSDIVLSIFCEGWPNCASECITRERIWPDIYSVKKITQSGFHLVPKSSAAGDFRLSFSCAETMLIRTLSPLQHKVIRAFKAVVKYYQNIWNPPVKEIISSYYLKTIAFWHFEKTSKEFWTEETLVYHILTLFTS
jgi:hypothetical protein